MQASGGFGSATNADRNGQRLHVWHSPMEKDKSAAECTRECVKKGTKYALVVGKKVYTLDGHEAELDKLAGERATVKGSMMGEMVMVESVAAAKKTAK